MKVYLTMEMVLSGVFWAASNVMERKIAKGVKMRPTVVSHLLLNYFDVCPLIQLSSSQFPVNAY